VADGDDVGGVDDDGLAKSKFVDGLGDGVDGGVVMAGVVFIWDDVRYFS
jgi:hypothetical protein